MAVDAVAVDAVAANAVAADVRRSGTEAGAARSASGYCAARMAGKAQKGLKSIVSPPTTSAGGGSSSDPGTRLRAFSTSSFWAAATKRQIECRTHAEHEPLVKGPSGHVGTLRLAIRREGDRIELTQ
jgi:hypothetical protein